MDRYNVTFSLKRLFVDVDECSDSRLNDCLQKCENTEGGYRCKCLEGYQETDGQCRLTYTEGLGETTDNKVLMLSLLFDIWNLLIGQQF